MNLSTCDVASFVPKVKEYSYNQFTGKPTSLIKPLFPQYIFAQFRVEDSIHKIRYTRGVHSVVRLGNDFIRVDDEIINMIKSRIQKDGLVRIGEEFEPGDEVKIRDGALKGFIGIFEREMSGEDRVMVMLNTISYQGHAVVHKTILEKVERRDLNRGLALTASATRK